MEGKRRILFCNEASWLSTGFSTYGRELLRRLHADGRFEVAELACYGTTDLSRDDRSLDVPWKVYPVLPDRNDPEALAEYESSVVAQFGERAFDAACLDFRPSVVCDARDPWMFEWQARSAFRDCFSRVLMPTVDAIPQHPEWLEIFRDADALLSYCDWGGEVLCSACPELASKYRGAAPPGFGPEFRPPENKAAHKRRVLGCGEEETPLIVGTLMRNQKRKLYPDLIASFAKFLERAPGAIRNRTRLWLHTSYPDVGWELPELIEEAGIGSKVLLTYLCVRCGAAFPSVWSHARTRCRSCGAVSAKLPDSISGVSERVLAEVLGCFDLYVQYASSEGFGIPQVEAAACGVPVASVDYSAMSDVVRKLEGFPIPVKALVREADTGCFRAVPDNDAFVDLLCDFLSLPDEVRSRRGRRAYLSACERYDRDRTARVWTEVLASLPVPDPSETWENPSPRAGFTREELFGGLSLPDVRILIEATSGLSDAEFVRRSIIEVGGETNPSEIRRLTKRMERELAWGAGVGCDTPRAAFNEMSFLGERYRPTPRNRSTVLAELIGRRERRIRRERERLARLSREIASERKGGRTR